MGVATLSITSVIAAYSVLLISFIILHFLKLKLFTKVIAAFARMTIQLTLVGFYLTIIFKYNSPLINLLYILIMMAVANYSMLKNSGLSLRFFAATFPAFLVSMFSVLIFFMVFIYQPDPVFDARYVIPIAGMLLGNSMNRTIITVERFYTSIRDDRDAYASTLSMGASIKEAILPYFRTAYKAGVMPSLANISTMGLVSLPGMMTGQILGGSDPTTAIMYQITIMLAIFAATELASLSSIFFTLRKAFDELQMLRHDLFKKS